MRKAKRHLQQKTSLSFVLLMFALVCAFALTGCGGGGGGGGGSAVMPDPMPGGGMTGGGTGSGTGGGQPPTSFTLEPGSERQLSQEVFLVCPSGGSPCNIQSVTEETSGQFNVQLAEISDTPFFWNSTTGLFAGGTLSPYEHRTVRLIGSENTHVVTCGQAVACDVRGLHINEQGNVAWKGSELLHVSADETGFFLKGDRIVTLPDGTEVLFSCPQGCGIDKIYPTGQGQYAYYYDPAWPEPSDNLATLSGQPRNTAPMNPVVNPTPPIQTSNYMNLPAEFTKFPVNHWELSDSVYWLVELNSRDFETIRDEVVCPGVKPHGNVCTINKKNPTTGNIEKNRLTTDYILSKLDGRIVAYSEDSHGYISFGPDLQNLQNLIDLNFNAFGAWGKYSAFGGMIIPDEQARNSLTSSYHWFAFGDLYDESRGGKPMPVATETSATWRGGMIAGWSVVSGSLDGGFVSGTSQLDYDFTENELDITLQITETGATAVSNAYPGERTIQWSNVKQNDDGSFFIQGNHKENTDPDLRIGVLDGDFYGPNAEEMAGIFERIMGNYLLRGVFGGKRQ